MEESVRRYPKKKAAKYLGVRQKFQTIKGASEISDAGNSTIYFKLL